MTNYLPELTKKVCSFRAEQDRLKQLSQEARSLILDICHDFGSLKYALTQFPELRRLITVEQDIENKINKSYKIKTRDQFENCDSLSKFLSELAILEAQS